MKNIHDGKVTKNVELTEDELVAIERALEHANANNTQLSVRLTVFRHKDIADASRTAYRKIGKAHRDINLIVGGPTEEEKEYL